MAKVTPRYTEAARRWWQRGGRSRKLPSEVSVHRTALGRKAFEACVRIGGGTISSKALKRASGYTTSCMFGRNPRMALSAALARAARQMKKRSGAFARYRRR